MDSSARTPIQARKGEKTMAGNERLIKIFEHALQQEFTGRAFFKSSLQRMGWGSAVSAFQRLIQEEEKHIEMIEKILSDLKKGSPLDLPSSKSPEGETINVFEERAKKEFLAQCLEGSMVPEVTIFNTAWLIEKDLSEFYEKMAGQTEGKAKEALMYLSRWEQAHEKLFREFHDQFAEMYSKIPWGG
jgi:rubrerythrin